MRSTRLLGTIAGLLLLGAGCGQGYCDPYYDPYCGDASVIDYGGVGIDPWGGCADPVFCGCMDAFSCLTQAPSVTATASPASTCAPTDTTCDVRPAATSVNQALQSVLMPVAMLLDSPGTRDGDRTVYGPMQAGTPGSNGNATAVFRLSVRRSTPAATWKLEATPLGSTSGWRTVFTGSMVPGDRSRRGKGVLGVDLDALASVNAAAYPDGGKVLASFDDVGGQKSTDYHLQAFHVGSEPALDGTLTSSTDGDGHVQTRLSFQDGRSMLVESPGASPAGGGSPSGPPAAPDPGAPPDAMPDPGF